MANSTKSKPRVRRTRPDDPGAMSALPPEAKRGTDVNDAVREDISNKYRRFLKAENAVRKKHRMWRIMDTFDRGEQWEGKAIPPWVPKPVTNIIRLVRTFKRANLASEIPRPSFAPEQPEDAQWVSQLQKAHDHVWDTERVERVIRRSIDRALLQGTAIVYVYNDESYVGGKYFGEGNPNNSLFRGRICVKRFPNTNFFPDPDAYSLDDCKYIETTEIMPLWKIKQNPAFIDYCKKNGTLAKLQNLSAQQLDLDDDANGTIFNRDNVPDNSNQLMQDYMATLHVHWERYFKDGKWHLDVTYYLRNTDFYLLKLEDVQPAEYPFAVLYDEEEENDFWGTATCADILENQKILNKTQQVAAVLAVLHQNPQKIVFRESGINAQELARTGTLPGKVWESNVPGEQAISIVKPMDIPPGVFEVDDRTKANINLTTGMNEAYTGQSVGSLTTSTGYQDLIERATIRDKDKMVQIDEFVERISHLIVSIIMHQWEDERPIMTLAPNGQPQFGTFKPIPKDFAENLSWRVKSNVYAKAPMTQATRRQTATQLMQYQGQFKFNPPLIIVEEFIDLMDFDNKEQILQRIQRDRALLQMQQAQNMGQQIVQLAQQIHQLIAQGLPAEVVQQQAFQAAQQLLVPMTVEEQQYGMTAAPQQQGAQVSPDGSGVMGATQAAAMQKGA